MLWTSVFWLLIRVSSLKKSEGEKMFFLFLPPSYRQFLNYNKSKFLSFFFIAKNKYYGFCRFLKGFKRNTMTEVRTSTILNKFAHLCLICQTRLGAWTHRKWAFQPLLKTDVAILHNHNDWLMHLFTVQRFVLILMKHDFQGFKDCLLSSQHMLSL